MSLAAEQVTALLTPTLALAAGDKPSKNVWLGCAMALCGTVLLTLDKAPSVAVPVNASHIAIGKFFSISRAFRLNFARTNLGQSEEPICDLKLHWKDWQHANVCLEKYTLGVLHECMCILHH